MHTLKDERHRHVTSFAPQLLLADMCELTELSHRGADHMWQVIQAAATAEGVVKKSIPSAQSMHLKL